MINIKKKSDCCGCYACENICPKKCINMNIDNEGFWYPDVNKSLCINCNLCEKVCPVLKDIKKDEFKTQALACKNKDEVTRLNSSSGGIFTNLCEYVIESNGIVFGAGFNERFEVEHSEAKTIEECKKFKGSKYVQSKIGNTYRQAKYYLDKGKIVLFSGTQCQIKGLNLYLGKYYPNLISVDIVCHGVPSPLVFDLYKTNLKKTYNSEIKSIGFREKFNGWKDFSYETSFENEQRYVNTKDKDLYMKGFLNDLYLRPSCYECKAKNFTSGSDITLADYWGIQNIHPEFDDDKGASLVFVNSEKGQIILNMISDKFEKICTDIEYAISHNSAVIKPVKYNLKREKFFKDINNDNINRIINKYTKISIYKKVIHKVKRILKNKG